MNLTDKKIDAQMMASYLAANGFGVLAVHEPHDPDDEMATHVVEMIYDISVLVYEKQGTAQVILRGDTEGRTPRLLDPVDSYIKAVRDARSLLPPKPERAPGPLASPMLNGAGTLSGW